MISVVYFEHVLVPHKRRTESMPSLSISALDPQWKTPYIALVDGKPVLRKDWNLVVSDGQILVFCDVRCIPQGGGGGGSNPMRMIAMLAVVALSTMVPGMQVFAGTMLATGTFGGAIMAGGIMLAGSALVNAVLPATTAKANNGTTNSIAAASPTYTLQAQGNTARLEQAIPEHFGRMLAYPDYAAMPYQEFVGNEQYLYCLLCIGRGEYSIEQIRIEDTAISNFADVQTEIVPPGGSLSLFPANAQTSSEVGGGELETGVYVGPFVVNSSETTCNYIGVDFVCRLYYARDDNSLAPMSLQVRVEARAIDDDGIAIGSWVTVGLHTYTAATTTPQRYSEKYAVAPGRYEVLVKREDTKQTDTRYGHEVSWGGLRAYINDARTYGDVTLLAVRMRASSQLTTMSSRKFNVIATRKLPIWDGSSWSSFAPTRSIAWAAAYCCKQIGATDQQIDMAELKRLDAVWSARGDYCDGRIDSFLGFWEALTQIVAGGRCKPYMQSGVIRFFRDEPATIPVAKFGMHNVIKGSFSVDYLMPTQDTADMIRVGYFDQNSWVPRRVSAALPESTSNKAAKMELSLVTQRNQAHREGVYQAACNRRRRKLPKFTTEMEGFIPSFGDLVLVQHDMPAWGQGGEVVGWDAPMRTLTLSDPLSWGSGTHYLTLSTRKGAWVGPYAATSGINEYTVVLAETPSITPDTDVKIRQRTRYSFGACDTWGQLCRVVSIRPRDTYRVEIQAINEDPYVHTAEHGLVTPMPTTSQLSGWQAGPALKGLRISALPNDLDAMSLSWEPAAWANSYIIEQSGDGKSWVGCGETRTNAFNCRAFYGADTIVRVAAMGSVLGPWVIGYFAGVSEYMWTGSDTDMMWVGSDTEKMWG